VEAILKFNLPEDETEFRMTTKARRAFNVLWDFQQEFRNLLKYRNPETEFKTNAEALDCVRQKFFDLLEENEIDLNRDYG